MVSKETLAEVLELSDKECAQALVMGLAILIRAKAASEDILQFVEGFINTVRLAEVDRVPVRDERAN